MLGGISTDIDKGSLREERLLKKDFEDCLVVTCAESIRDEESKKLCRFICSNMDRTMRMRNMQQLIECDKHIFIYVYRIFIIDKDMYLAYNGIRKNRKGDIRYE